MNAASAVRLYTPELLGLAVSLADYPLTEDLLLRSEAHSRTCGSAVAIGLTCDDAGRIEKLGMMVSACAVGQAAAAIFASGALTADAARIQDATEAVENWLSGNADQPYWPGISALEAARDYPARHGVITLPWKAASDALCKAKPPR